MLFVQDQYQYLVTKSVEEKHVLASQFANQEFLLTLPDYVQGFYCTVLGSMTAPADQALQLLLLLDTLQQHGATEIVLISPYLGYQRQDKFAVGASYGLQWADKMLYAAGVTRIVTLEPHNFASLGLLKVPVVAHSSELFFGQDMAYFIALGFGCIFPDSGAAFRHSWVVEKFPQAAQGFFHKQRIHGMVEFTNFQGKVGRKMMIIDDILDSGQTLVQLSIILRQMGVEEIIVFVTHAFFHGYVWHDLWDLGVQFIYCTNSLPAAHRMQHPKIRCQFISFLLQNYD